MTCSAEKDDAFLKFPKKYATTHSNGIILLIFGDGRSVRLLYWFDSWKKYLVRLMTMAFVDRRASCVALYLLGTKRDV